MLRLDRALTQEYYRALEVTPQLVRQESRVTDFLRASGNDPAAAAARLARYWKTRHLLFGDHRWLLPMSQTGSGCLAPEFCKIVRTGFITAVTDPQGHVLLVGDFACLPEGSIHIQSEALFYFLTLYPVELSMMFVVRHNRQRPALTPSGLIQRIMDSVATTVKKIIVVRAYAPGREHLLDYLGYQQRRITENNTQRKCDGYVAANSVHETLRQLQAHGFGPSCLPASVGGYLDRSVFDNWVRARLTIEDALSAAPLRQNYALSAALTLHSEKKAQRAKERLALVQYPNETAVQFRKRKNAAYVRRVYHRQKLERMAVEGGFTKAKQWQAVLKAENLRLQGLLQQAQWWIQQQHGAGGETSHH